MHNIQSMFTSATLKLTAWYLMIVMAISLGFSALIYTTSISEVSERFKNIETKLRETLPEPSKFDFANFRRLQIDEAQANLVTVLLYTNLIILGVGGAASYLWARQTLRPIEESHEAQSRFTSDASHELRTPLAVMKTEIEYILRYKKATKEDYRETLKSNLEEVNRLSDLSNLLLRMARLETRLLEWDTIDLIEAARVAVQSFSTNQQKRVKLSHAAKKIDLPHANRESIIELMIILIDNALKYSPPKTKVAVTLWRAKGHVYCSVSNRGEGISQDDINHIFQRFYQANTSRNKEIDGGYGLGLALAHKIVQLHRGEISVQSVKDETTTFTVKFN